MASSCYAALLSLARSLNEILDLEQRINPLHKEKIVSLHKKVDFIVAFLEDYSDKHRRPLDCVGNGVRNAAYGAQDLMDLYLGFASKNGLSSSEDNRDEVRLDQDLNMAFERIEFIWEEMMKIKNSETAADLRLITHSSPVGHSSTVEVMARDMVAGLGADLNAIKELLYEDSAKLMIIPIVGMGGIGKTTLAKRAYEDSLVAQYFDTCAWITVSAEYQRREILSGLLQCLTKKPGNEQSDKSEAQLAKLIYQNLIGRRYLIVIDDIWSTKAWDYLKMMFPDDSIGSRILLTTRLSDVAVQVGSSSTTLHRMNLLDEDQSWKLLREKIFGQESCPLQLVDIGKRIARNCRGLPLTIVVVAGLLLSTGNIMKQESWQNILGNISLREPTIALHCSKILYLSYEWLPLRLKPCFLYMAAFPEDSNINVFRLIMLWAAEGFLKPIDQSKSLEHVGEQYLEDLVNRNLILVSKKDPDGKLKMVGIHDLLREICITKAEEEGFLHVSSERNGQKDATENPNRRLSVHCEYLDEEHRISESSVRSVLLFSERVYFSLVSISCWHLNIFYAPEVTWTDFSDVVSTFINLRCVAFCLNARSCFFGFPASISELPSLQTMIVHVNDFGRNLPVHVPFEIFEMPKLRHLIMDRPFYLSSPSEGGTIQESDLQTVDTVINFAFTEAAIKTLVNLKKLKVLFAMDRADWDSFNLNNLFHLENLEEFHVYVNDLDDPSVIWNHAFPISLKKLTLHGVPLPWENMSIIGSLPNLQVLEMMRIEGIGVSEWTPTEGEFLLLKHFCSSLDYLEKWEVEKEHLPSLESLILKGAKWIDEIPCGIGEIDSLQVIELHNCGESLVDSARRIHEQRHENGNDAFRVRVFYSNK